MVQAFANIPHGNHGSVFDGDTESLELVAMEMKWIYSTILPTYDAPQKPVSFRIWQFSMVVASVPYKIDLPPSSLKKKQPSDI